MTTFLFLLNVRRDGDSSGVRLLGFLDELEVLKDERAKFLSLLLSNSRSRWEVYKLSVALKNSS